MKEALPINNSILIWARETAGLTVDQLAHRLKKDKQTILDWEKGLSSPTYTVLEALAYEVYKRPVAMFFFPELPYEDSIKTTFRTLPGTDIEQLPSEISNLLRKASAMQLNLFELYSENAIEPITNVFELTTQTNIQLLAKKVRDEIGISIDEQMSWKSVENGLKRWRSALESKQIAVFKEAFRNSSYSGFCLYDELHPLIYINNSLSFSRQIFTLFHELAHLFMKSSGIDFTGATYVDRLPDNYKNYEILCNKFAAELLVPDAVFSKIPLAAEEEQIEHIASLFSVSREMILRKCLDKKLCDLAFYRHYAEKWNDDYRDIKKNKENDGGNYYNTMISYLGDKYIHDSFRAYYRNRISQEQLSSYFNVSVKNAMELEKRVMG